MVKAHFIVEALSVALSMSHSVADLPAHIDHQAAHIMHSHVASRLECLACEKPC